MMCGREQTQPLAQSALVVHAPPHATAGLPLRSWRAEAAPAHKTELMMVANSAFLAILLNMIRTPFAT
jgi:hypothetical protein